MAQLLDGAGELGWVLLKSVIRFVFMVFNNCAAIPSYCLYLVLLQPLRIWDSSAFWHIEGIMFKWLLAMVSSWGWIAGYTGKRGFTRCTLGVHAETCLHGGLGDKKKSFLMHSRDSYKKKRGVVPFSFRFL